MVLRNELRCFWRNLAIRYPVIKIVLFAFIMAFCVYIMAAVTFIGKSNVIVVSDPESILEGNGVWKPKNDMPTVYVSRKNMAKCNHVYGKVMVFVAVEPGAYKKKYKVALDSLRCYIGAADYELKILDVFNDTRVAAKCNHTTVFSRKHCAVSVYLEDTDWMMVLDADTGIVNPNHCIEEYIDPRVDMIFYDRFFNWEITAGNYLAKNSEFSRDFLTRWANYEFVKGERGWWKGYDNGALHIVFLETLFPKDSQEVKNCHKIWHAARSYETYIPYVFCVRAYLGGTRIWPGKLKLLRRAHGFCRDRYATIDAWCEKDFMIHCWKERHVGDKGWQSPFLADFDISKCGQDYDGWLWRPEKKRSVAEIKRMLHQAEITAAKKLLNSSISMPYLTHPDVGQCYPDCDIPERVPGVAR